MPPPPLFKSARVQTIAVAVLMAVFLLCATGLAYLQAGEGESFFHDPSRRVQRLKESKPGESGAGPAMLIDTPSDWQVLTDEPGRLVAQDPDRPSRSLTLLTVLMPSRTQPYQVLQEFIRTHLPPTALETLGDEPHLAGFKNEAQGVFGVQFMGTSRASDDDGRLSTKLHLIACLTQDGHAYATIYLTDTVESHEADVVDALHAEARLLDNICKSTRVVQE